MTDGCPGPFKHSNSPFSVPLVTAFTDDFATYSVGPLTGQGPWLTFGSKHWVVDGGGGVIPQGSLLGTNEAPVTFDPTAFWLLTSNVTRSTTADAAGTFIAAIGSFGFAGYAVRLTWSAGDGAANLVSLVEVVVDGATVASAGPVSWSDGAAHLVAYQFDGAFNAVTIDGVAIIPPTAGVSGGAAAEVVIEGQTTGAGDVLRLNVITLQTH